MKLNTRQLKFIQGNQGKLTGKSNARAPRNHVGRIVMCRKIGFIRMRDETLKEGPHSKKGTKWAVLRFDRAGVWQKCAARARSPEADLQIRGL